MIVPGLVAIPAYGVVQPPYGAISTVTTPKKGSYAALKTLRAGGEEISGTVIIHVPSAA